MGQANSALQMSGNPTSCGRLAEAARRRTTATLSCSRTAPSCCRVSRSSARRHRRASTSGRSPGASRPTSYSAAWGLARGSIAARHITEAFTDGELDCVIGDGNDGQHGMEVPVFDGEGRRYDLTCGYSGYTMCYRLFGGAGEFGRFGANNSEVRDVAVGKDKLMKVFTFRSPTLRPVEVHGHQDGALGMIVLFYDLNAMDAVKNDLLDTDTLTVNQIMKHSPKLAQRMLESN
uniref:Uncharacterized protein n=1 Tax=Oryza punctata TaxID=4537 RepID=A0A0E0LJU4_ORYPU